MDVQIIGMLDVVGGCRLRFEICDSVVAFPTIYSVGVFLSRAVDYPPLPTTLVAGSIKGHLKGRDIEPVMVGNRIMGLRASQVYSIVVDTRASGWHPVSKNYFCLDVCHISVLDMINECS